MITKKKLGSLSGGKTVDFTKNSALSMFFPIGAKLIVIVTLILLVSLGLITFLVSFFVSRDVEDTAWETNVSINGMSSAAAEMQVSAIEAKVSVLLGDSIVLKADEARDMMTDDFFKENAEIACIYTLFPLSDSPSDGPALLQNTAFFEDNNLQSSMIDAFLTLNRRYFVPDKTETALFNAAPVLNGLPILALVFQGKSAAISGVIVVFFSSESITTALGTGTNSTILINTQGDILVAADQTLLTDGTNVANMPFVSAVLESNVKSLRERYKDNQGRDYFGVSERLPSGSMIAITTIPADVVFEGINATTWRNILLSIGVWFLSILFLWFFAKSISQPLKTLTGAAKVIEDGDYHLDIVSKGQDETGVLTRSVLSMSHVLENFESFTNKEIARLARQGKLELTGSSKQITMFFSDIRSFTAISEKLPPNEVVEFLNEYMERMVACVLVTGGAIDKFIGDAIMAYWGAINTSGSPELDAISGVKAALMMRAQLKCFNEGRGGDKKPIIKIGCGLNSGTAVAGQIGSAERVVFTVIGDTVSLADRTETLNKPFATEILITEHTNNLIENLFITEKMGAITEDGEKLGMYAVINIRPSPECDQLLTELSRMPHINMEIAKKCVGPGGPQTLEEVRLLLNIPAPDLANLNLDEEEKKYRIKDDKREAPVPEKVKDRQIEL